jgi:hypothetical protein
MLALGDDAVLKELADKDLAAPEGASEQAEVGDAWWDQAKATKTLDKAQMERRAFYWYTRAVSLLSDSDQTRVEKRIASLLKQIPDLRASWDLLDFPKASVKDGFLRLSPPNRRSLVTKMSYAGPIEINAVARTNGKNIRLYAGPGGMLIFNWEGKAGELRVHRPDDLARGAQGSLASSKPAPLNPDTWYALRWRITENGMAVYVNELPVFAEVKHYDLSAKWPVKASQAIDSVVDVKSLTVTRPR